MITSRFPCIRQRNQDDCGAAALATVARQYGSAMPLPYLRAMMGKSGEGTSLLGIVQAATKIGFQARGLRVQDPQMMSKLHLPFIAHTIIDGQGHFVVIQSLRNGTVRIADPAVGRRRVTISTFSNEFTGFLVELHKTEKLQRTTQCASPFKFLAGELNSIDHLVGLSALAAILITILGLGLSFFTRILTAVAQDPASVNHIQIVLVEVLSLLLIRTSCSLGRGLLITEVSERLSRGLLHKFCCSVLQLPSQLYSVYSPGELADQMVDALRVRDGVNLAASSLLVDGATILITCLMLSILAPVLAVMIVIIMSLCGFVLFLLQPRQAHLQAAVLGSLSKLQGYVGDGLEHIWSIKGCHLEEAWLAKADGAVETFLGEGRHLMRWGILTAGVQDIAANSIIAGTAAICLLGVQRHFLAPINVVMIYTFALFAVAPFTRVSLSMLQLQEGLASLERLSGTLLTANGTVPPGSRVKAIVSEATDIHISVSGVSFAFSGHRPLLEKLNLEIRRGEKIALMGPSGSGKTTLIKLLAGLQEPSSGSIRVHDTSGSVDSTAAYLDHRPFIVSGTLEQNVVFGQHAPPAEIERAVEAAGLESLIKQRGWHKPVDRGGAEFSSGERQRVVLARALLAQKGLLLLDEALDSLDVQAAITIMQLLTSSYPKITMIIITHRPQTIPANFRRIYLAAGAIHDEVYEYA
jgi:ATP-binding cassette, subfamily C, bacteriocin exporter